MPFEQSAQPKADGLNGMPAIAACRLKHMIATLLIRFSVVSAITFALAYGPILRKLSLGLVSPYPKADMAKRIFAATVDIMLVAVTLLYYRASESFGYLVLAIAFLLFRDAIGGRSFGKFVFGLVVTDLETGRPCGYGAAIRRNALFLLPGANVVSHSSKYQLSFEILKASD
jgi:RDD family protein